MVFYNCMCVLTNVACWSYLLSGIVRSNTHSKLKVTILLVPPLDWGRVWTCGLALEWWDVPFLRSWPSLRICYRPWTFPSKNALCAQIILHSLWPSLEEYMRNYSDCLKRRELEGENGKEDFFFSIYSFILFFDVFR